jgi:uncharacterized repeat protein (TIGR03833 family)
MAQSPLPFTRSFTSLLKQGTRKHRMAMTVPKRNQISPGTQVNIVLKVDQPSGKLTTGSVQDLLTRGDHPRGVKVRLTNGHIGRVQSLSTQSPGEGMPSSTIASQISIQGQVPTVQSGHFGNRRGIQDDYRLDPTPDEAPEASLLDYVKPAKQKKGKKGRKAPPPDELVDSDMTAQQQLAIDFPKLDSALIAALLLDHGGDVAAARVTLSSLS